MFSDFSEVRRVLYYRYMAAVAIVTSVCAMLAVVALNSPHNSLKCRVGGVCMQSLITLLVCLASCMAVEDYLYTLRRYSPEFVRYTRNACQVGMISKWTVHLCVCMCVCACVCV